MRKKGILVLLSKRMFTHTKGPFRSFSPANDDTCSGQCDARTQTYCADKGNKQLVLLCWKGQKQAPERKDQSPDHG